VRRIAVRKQSGTAPGIFWLGGFKSDMRGTKAEALGEHAARTGRAYVRFDSSGHGESGGRFEDGTISRWLEEALAVFNAHRQGPQIVVGSSMGGWIATLLALAHPEKVAAMVFVAPAPDFTELLMWPSFSQAQRDEIMRDGKIELPSDYADEPEIITRKHFEDGREHLVMSKRIAIRQPVRILQGMKDDAVPYTHALAFAALLESDDVEITLTPGGDHRLSTPADLARLSAVLDRF
jgi:pimeloyl-ACP methyl ester carboxylesterase